MKGNPKFPSAKKNVFTLLTCLCSLFYLFIYIFLHVTRHIQANLSKNTMGGAFCFEPAEHHPQPQTHEVRQHKCLHVYVYAFSRRFYPNRLTNEDITLQLTSKLTINYIEENH